MQKNRIITIDCEFMYPQFAACYLIIEDDKAVFIDNNTSFAVPLLLDRLQKERVSPYSVEYIIVTHLHLDHAGGTSLLAQKCPNAKIIAHPRAVRHLINPEKLIKSAIHVYGEKIFNKLYGQIEQIDSSRIRPVDDNEVISFKNTDLKFIHTRGHAKHHICIHDSLSNSIFTGDSFGLAYPIAEGKNGRLIFPSTSPVDYEPLQALKSIDRIVETGADRAYLTHFAVFEDIKWAAVQMKVLLKKMRDIYDTGLQSFLQDEDLLNFCRENVKNIISEKCHELDLPIGKKLLNYIAEDIKLNGDGIAHAIVRDKNI